MKEKLIEFYSNTDIKIRNKQKDEIKITYLFGAKVTIIGDGLNYRVEMIDTETNILEYTTIINGGEYAESTKKYFIKWLIKVYDSFGNLITTDRFNPENKSIYIQINSDALGDTLAWVPYLSEFTKNNKCNVVAYTKHNNLFKEEYKEIIFVDNRLDNFDGFYAIYKIGWFYQESGEINLNFNPFNFRQQPLQKTCSDILGINFTEIKPRISFVKNTKKIKNKYIVIAPHSTLQSKYWNNKDGWQKIINYFIDLKYDVILISKEKLGDPLQDIKLNSTFNGVIDKSGDIDFDDRINDIKNASLFIGLGSGLSWLSWALGTKTIIISGFSRPYSEFSDAIRVFNNDNNVCSGCYNFNKLGINDWYWCPQHKNTDRRYECSKTITPNMVIDVITNNIF